MFFLGFLLSSIALYDSSVSQTDIIYTASSGRTIEVYRQDDGMFFETGRAYLKDRRKTGDFGGAFKDCSNEAFKCISGSINISIPRNFTEKWSYMDQSCHVVKVIRQDYYRVTCQPKNWPGVNFVFKSGVGVISYSVLSDPLQKVYRLRSRTGLLL